jgi:hypothetical protein
VTKPAKLPRPDINLEAMLTVVSVILGFLFVVVIYLLEFPSEVTTIWGVPLTMFLVICYSVGLSFIAFMIGYELNHYLANRTMERESSATPSPQVLALQQRSNASLRRSIQMLLIFIPSFGLFLINLVGFAATKFFAGPLSQIELMILMLFGELGLLAIRLTVMFVVQLVLLIPFTQYFGNLWTSYQSLEGSPANE